MLRAKTDLHLRPAAGKQIQQSKVDTPAAVVVHPNSAGMAICCTIVFTARGSWSVTATAVYSNQCGDESRPTKYGFVSGGRYPFANLSSTNRRRCSAIAS